MKKIYVITIIVVFAIIAGISIYQKTRINNDVVVKIGYLPIITTSPFYWMTSLDEFSKNNIKITSTKFDTSNQLFESLVKGDIDVAMDHSILPILLNQDKTPGLVKAFAMSDMTMETFFDKIIVKKDNTIQNSKELENKKIGVFPGTTARNFLKQYLKENNIDASNIEFVQLPSPNQLPALLAGSIDALYTYEPVVAQGKTNDTIRIIDGPIYPKLFPHTPIGIMALSTKFVQRYPSLAKKVVTLFQNANKKSLEDPQKTKQILAQSMNLDPQIINNFNLVPEIPIEKEHIKKFVSYLVGIGELQKEVNIDSIIYSDSKMP